MSIERLWSLEGRVERLAASVEALARQVAALAQQLWQIAGRGVGGGSVGLSAVRLTGGLTAGSIASPTDNDAFLLNPDGSDGPEINVKNRYADSLATGSRFGWAQQIGSDYYYVAGGCSLDPGD